LQGVEFVVANTDAQALQNSLAPHKIQLGASITKGLGAGAAPAAGAAAAEESEEEIRKYLQNNHMVFITAGMGGGTGTGSAPIIARMAKEMGILTVGVVTKPFFFEGAVRMKTADKGLLELQQYVDTMIIIPNQNLFRVATDRTTFIEAFKMADNVLFEGVRSITDLIIMPGLINLDFADIKTVMKDMGKAMMGTGEATGEDRALRAAEAAISNPLIDANSINGAQGLLINISSDQNMTLSEVDEVNNFICKAVNNTDANIIFGSTFNSSLEGILRVSIVATGIDRPSVPLGEDAKNFGLGDMLNGFVNNRKSSQATQNNMNSLDPTLMPAAIIPEEDEVNVEVSKQPSKVDNQLELFASANKAAAHGQNNKTSSSKTGVDIYSIPTFLRNNNNNNNN
jgi:cell division protein FtsZ